MLLWFDVITGVVTFVGGLLIGMMLYSLATQARLPTVCLTKGEIVLQDVTFKCEVKR